MNMRLCFLDFAIVIFVSGASVVIGPGCNFHRFATEFKVLVINLEKLLLLIKFVKGLKILQNHSIKML
jgi:hypothetical protein